MSNDIFPPAQHLCLETSAPEPHSDLPVRIYSSTKKSTCPHGVESHPESYLLHEKQVATWLGLPSGTLRRWRCVGEGPPFIKLGRGPKARVRYDARDIAAYVEQGKRFSIIRAGNTGRGK